MKRQETRITVRFPSELISQLRTFLEQDDRSLNAEIVQAVREFVARRDPALQRRSLEMPLDVPPVNGADRS
jgi:predicted transcriptional regulator